MINGTYGVADSVTNHEKQCTKEWEKLEQNKAYSSTKTKLNYWKSLKNKNCSATGLYHYKLAWLYVMNGEYDVAKQQFKTASKKPTNYKKEIELSLVDLYFQQAARNKTRQSEYLNLAEKGYKNYIKKYPNYGSGYSQMTDLMLLRNNFKQVIAYGEKAVALKALRPPYRSLTIAYQRLNQPDKSVENYKKAYGYDKGVLKDLDFMISVAAAYAEIGQYQMSKGALVILARNHKGVEKTESFKMIAKYISEHQKK